MFTTMSSNAAQLIVADVALLSQLLGYQLDSSRVQICDKASRIFSATSFIKAGIWRDATTTTSWFQPPRGLPM